MCGPYLIIVIIVIIIIVILVTKLSEHIAGKVKK